jgi:catechol 2,3-dioxygenase-like lactoylglutathione lyase family enzyme
VTARPATPSVNAMINALHTLIYAEDPDAARAFFRDVLQFPNVDTGGGWLIFRTGPSETGVHPSSWEYEGTAGRTDQRFDVSLMCDDLAATMEELRGRGATFEGEVGEQPWGSTIELVVPGAGTITLYQPKYPSPAIEEDPQPMG